jgi:hypothetical protein
MAHTVICPVAGLLSNATAVDAPGAGAFPRPQLLNEAATATDNANAPNDLLLNLTVSSLNRVLPKRNLCA